MAIHKVYTIGFAEREAKEFFETLKIQGVRQLIDIRLKNSSQLSGYAKKRDPQYFLKEICGITYRHELILAPTQEILENYKKKRLSWPDYEKQYNKLMEMREVEKCLAKSIFNVPSVLLCSEKTAEKCHRRLAIEYLQSKWRDIEIVHL